MIKSKLLSLRPIELNDDIILQQLINNPLVSENVVGWTFPVSLFSQKNWIQSNINNLSYRLVVVDNETNEAIGITGLWDIDWHNQAAMSAIKLLPEKTKKGFGTEAIMLSMAWAFYNVGLRRLHGAILDFNGPSMGAYVKKCGWKVEGVNERQYFVRENGMISIA
jgi:RimJ/RimL family protein N-acetyltransferase